MSTAIYRTVEIGTWDDARFSQLSAPTPNAQTLWLYMLTGPRTGVIPGLYVFSVAETAERFHWTVRATRRVFDEILAAGMASYDESTRLLWLPKATDRKCNTPNSLNVVKAWRKAWSGLPPCELRTQAGQTIHAFLVGKSVGFADEFGVVKAYDTPLVKGDEIADPKALDTPPSNATQVAGSSLKISSGISIPPTPPTRAPRQLRQSGGSR